jgi:hypothetical protein
MHKKSVLLCIMLNVLLTACAPPGSVINPTAVPPTTPTYDEATGLELNPVVVPAGEFVVLGRITAVNLIPQNAPLIKIAAENGQNYQILAQPVPQIRYEDGTAVPPLEIKNGRQIRATVQQNETGGLGGEPVLVSSNLTVLDTD